MEEILVAHSLPEELRSELAIGLLGVEVKVLERCLERVMHGVQIDFGSAETNRSHVSTPVDEGKVLSVVWPKFVELMVTEDLGLDRCWVRVEAVERGVVSCSTRNH